MSSDSLEIFFEGEDYFTRLGADIEAAVSCLDVEFYTFESDAFGWEFAELLGRKAEGGLKVRVLLDDLGSLNTSEMLLMDLRQRGVELRVFNPVFPGLRNFTRRDHRKMVVIDGQIGYLGGFNIGVEYWSRYSGEGSWRDTGARVTQSHLVQDMQALFEDAWYQAQHPLHRFSPRRRRPSLQPGTLSIVSSDGRKRRGFIREEYLSAIIRSKQSIDLTNPYFIPDHGILRALKKAARRGVKVRLLTAGMTDVRVAMWAGQATYSGLLKAGVRIFEYQGRVMHAKSAVIDAEWFTLGTSNLDHWSFVHNLELNLMGRDGVASAALSAQFDKDLRESVEISWEKWKQRSWFDRLRERFFFYFRKWL